MEGGKDKEQARRELLALSRQRKEMEREIAELHAALTAPDGPGLRGGLIDAQGFPIDDTQKVISVREQRHRLACLQTDLKSLMAQIEAGVLVVFGK
jgi:26S proteasome non-ATPase regulatory subunit 9